MPEELFAKGLFRNIESGAKLNTENFTGRDSLGNVISGGLTADNLEQQGFEALTSKLTNGGELFSSASGYQEFIQRPKGFGIENEPDVVFSGPDGEVKNVDPNDHEGMKKLQIIGFNADNEEFQPDQTPNIVSTDSVFDEAGELDARLAEQKRLLSAEQLTIKTETEELIKGIEADAKAKEASAQAGQAEDRKTEKAIQFRLGQSGSAFGLDQIKKNDLIRRGELQGILDEKQSLLAKARTASASDNTKLLKEYTKNINDLDDKYFERQRQQRQDRINEYVKINQEDRAQRKEITDFAKASREETQAEVEKMAIGGVSSAELTDNEKMEMEQSLGLLPGTFAPYYDKLVLANEAKEQKDELALNKSIMDMIAMVPEGEMIQIGDSLYEGTEQPDVFTIKEEDATGNVTAIGVDKVSGEELWRQNLGKIGKGFKAGAGGAGALNAGDLYSGQISEWIRGGETNIDNITFALQQVAYDSGTTLSVKDLNAIRVKAQELVASGGILGGGGNIESGFVPSTEPGVGSGGYVSKEGELITDIPAVPGAEALKKAGYIEGQSDEAYFAGLGLGDNLTLDEDGNIVNK